MIHVTVTLTMLFLLHKKENNGQGNIFKTVGYNVLLNKKKKENKTEKREQSVNEHKTKGNRGVTSKAVARVPLGGKMLFPHPSLILTNFSCKRLPCPRQAVNCPSNYFQGNPAELVNLCNIM